MVAVTFAVGKDLDAGCLEEFCLEVFVIIFLISVFEAINFFLSMVFGSEVVFELELTDGFSALDLNAGVGLECVIGFVVGFF